MSNIPGGPTCISKSQHGYAVAQGSSIGEHALRLAIQIQKQQPPGTSAWKIFQFLGRMVASCVFYDCIRNRRGKIRDIFSECYQPPLELMLQRFCDHHLPCSFVDRSGRQCAGTKINHGADHHTGKGKAIGTGHYESDFFFETYDPEWICFLKTELNECQDEYWEALEVTPPETSSRRVASDLHLEQMNDFFADLGTALPFTSHASCFGCLVETPRHPLPCGHVLCDNCVRDHGKKSYSRMQLDFCPLHIQTSFTPPWEVSFKPDNVGVRILCLDGGGMRGIVELEVLQAIEKALGDNMPIQSFFDLIVGTSTGGINALALGVKQWPVKYCISVFEKFCDQAFTEREFGGVWALEKAALLNHGSMYKARPLHNAFQATLGRNSLFGGNDSLSAFRTSVAVTATSGDGKEAMIITNYNRPQNAADSQILVRPEDPANELQVWEAAAATSAAPFYFKPYQHTKTGKSYIDGALYHNNPVHVANRERKLLWPDVANRHPDILLSVGTGQNLLDIEAETSERRSPGPSSEGTAKAIPKKSRGIRRTFDTFGALYQRFDNILDAEQTWSEFEADINDRNENYANPYVRLNLDLRRKPPPFDAKDKFKELQRDVKLRLDEPDMIATSNDIACSLVASSFYFKTGRVISQRHGRFTCSGYIRCKFEEASSNLRGLGQFLQKQNTRGFTPYFLIRELSSCTPEKGVKVEITKKAISRMATYGMLKLPHIDIEVSNAITSTAMTLVLAGGCDGEKIQHCLLSGFPRTLVQEIPCKPLKPSSHSDSAVLPTKRRDGLSDRPSSDSRSRLIYSERPRTSETSSRTPPLPPRPPPQVILSAPPLPPRPSPRHNSPALPYQHSRLHRHDSAFDLPQHLRPEGSPKYFAPHGPIARTRNAPRQQSLTYAQPSHGGAVPVHLVKRAVRQLRDEHDFVMR